MFQIERQHAKIHKRVTRENVQLEEQNMISCAINDTNFNEKKIAMSEEEDYLDMQISDGIMLFNNVITPPAFNARSHLPSASVQRESISLWSILKSSIGKDLSRITMPVVFNEPLSMLQRLAEYLEYSDLPKMASQEKDAVKRLEYVAAFACSSLACNWERIAKPFNPLLYETYELSRYNRRVIFGPDIGFEFVSEQVSHHPPVSAFFARGEHFEYSGSVHPKLKFWGRAVQVEPKGIHTLKLKNHDEIYTWSGVNCSVHNLVMGTMYLEQDGVMEIVCHKNALKCTLQFKPCSGWFGRDTSDHIIGHIVDKNKTKLRALYGEWTSFLASCPVHVFDEFFHNWAKDTKEHRSKKERLTTKSMSVCSAESHLENGIKTESHRKHKIAMPIVNGSDVLWSASPRPECSHEYYNFTSFALLLNELTDINGALIAPTDSRFRPDIRNMEDGNMDEAGREKHRLEEKQREARKVMKRSDEQHPLWFYPGPHPLVKEDTWHFNNEYFKRNWSKCPDIF